MFVNYPIKFVIEDKDITSMDRVQVEVLKMMNKCTFREIRLVSNFHLRGYNFFPSYFTHKKLSKVITYCTSDMIQLPLLILAS